MGKQNMSFYFCFYFVNYLGGGRKSVSGRKKSIRETVNRMTKMMKFGGNGGDGIQDTDEMGKPIDPRFDIYFQCRLSIMQTSSVPFLVKLAYKL